MPKIKLYFCGECGLLDGAADPENEEGKECENCSEAFDGGNTAEGEFDEENAKIIFRANGKNYPN